MKKTCDFCDCTETEENKIIGTHENNICRSCAETALYLMEIEAEDTIFAKEETVDEVLKTPKDYKKILDKYVIGQDEAKKVLSVAVYNHIQKIKNKDTKMGKSNVLFIGPTGSGKTYLAETIADHLDLPLAIVNTTSLTAAGYIGEDVTSVLERLWKDADEDIERTEHGIIFLDEIDKNATSMGGTNNKDVSGKAVQQELLKILEGDKVKIYPEGSKKNRKSGEAVEINTANILFIAGGAFVGLKDKPGVQMNALGKVKPNDKKVPDTEELINYGMIPEFIGRFPMIVELNEITEHDMKHILTEPKDNIMSQFTNLFKLSGATVKFTEEFILKVAKEALEKKTGARGLRNIMENKLIDFMFDIDLYDDKEITIGYKDDKIELVHNKIEVLA